jgi:hypothetical protein
MAGLPQSKHDTRSAIFAHYEQTAERGGRPHLGASEIGHECERYLWLSFRWALDATFEGRMLRLFARGNLEEARLIADLRAIGVTVHDTDEEGKQFRVTSVGGHFAGSMDGAAIGIPEAPQTWHVLEFKTANAASFKNLGKGVAVAKPQHYAQMQVYMGLTGMERALYLCVNKDTEDIYEERVVFDQAAFDRLEAKARRVIESPEPPLALEPTALPCKWCRMGPICHGQQAPQANCRTCCHSTPLMDGEGRWVCELKGCDIDLETQRKGCEEHRHIPQLLSNWAELIDASGNRLEYRNKISGKSFDQPGYSSQELHNMGDKRLVGDKILNALKQDFAATITAERVEPKDIESDLPWLEPLPSAKPAKRTRR